MKNTIELLERCEKSFGKFDEIINLLKGAKPEDLPELVNAIDLDIPLMQAIIKDEIARIKKQP